MLDWLYDELEKFYRIAFSYFLFSSQLKILIEIIRTTQKSVSVFINFALALIRN